MVFRDRRDAGRQLGRLVASSAVGDDAVVLALPRGGVPVGYEVARALGAPMDVFVVRKLGLPRHPELAMGAIATGGVRVLNHELVRGLGIPGAVIDAVTRREQEELLRREQLYRGDRPPLPLRGRTAVVVDDGMATGASMRAALAALRQLGPARVVVALPVAPASAPDELEGLADQTLVVAAPERFEAVGLHYGDFSQTTDAEVRDLLDRAAPGAGRGEPPVTRPSRGA